MNMNKMISIVSIFAAIAIQGSIAFGGPLVSGGGDSSSTNTKVLGEGGMGECFTLAVSAALEVHAQDHTMLKMPFVVAEESHGSPSNGMDIQVTIDRAVRYYVIASPNVRMVNGKPSGLLGCTDARVTSKVLAH